MLQYTFLPKNEIYGKKYNHNLSFSQALNKVKKRAHNSVSFEVKFAEYRTIFVYH